MLCWAELTFCLLNLIKNTFSSWGILTRQYSYPDNIPTQIIAQNAGKCTSEFLISPIFSTEPLEALGMTFSPSSSLLTFDGHAAVVQPIIKCTLVTQWSTAWAELYVLSETLILNLVFCVPNLFSATLDARGFLREEPQRGDKQSTKQRGEKRWENLWLPTTVDWSYRTNRFELGSRSDPASWLEEPYSILWLVVVNWQVCCYWLLVRCQLYITRQLSWHDREIHIARNHRFLSLLLSLSSLFAAKEQGSSVLTFINNSDLPDMFQPHGIHILRHCILHSTGTERQNIKQLGELSIM